MNSIIKYILLILVVGIGSTNLLAQDLKPQFRSWWEYELSYKFAKKLKGSFSQIYSFNTNPYSIGFVQNDFYLSYRIKKRAYIRVGYVWSWFKDSPSIRNKYGLEPNFVGLLDFNRVYLTFSGKHRFFSKRIWLKHTGSLQLFFPQLEKYKYRITYSAKLYFKIKNFPMKGVPYLENKFYYYLGGTPINYYDLQGNVVATNPPNGLHRYRIKIGVRLRPSKAPFYITPYYFYQRELNFLSQFHGLNRVHPIRGTTKYRFSAYNVLGLRLAYNFKK